MIDPMLWASTPFNNRTALQDYFGMEAIYHKVIADEAGRRGLTYRSYPLGNGGGDLWLNAHQKECVAAAAAFGIPGPPDLSAFDLNREEDFAAYHLLNSQFHRTLRDAARIP